MIPWLLIVCRTLLFALPFVSVQNITAQLDYLARYVADAATAVNVDSPSGHITD